MARFDMKNTSDNFDKEFSMKGRKSAAAKGKLPSWLLIAAGAAAMGGVVIARQPAVRTSATVVNSYPTVEAVSGDPAALSGINDEEASPEELAIRFGDDVVTGSQIFYTPDEQPFSMQMEPLETDEHGLIIAPAEEKSDAVVYWVDNKPYALTVETVDGTQPAAKSGQEATTYRIGEEDYYVTLEPVSTEELTSLSDSELGSLVQVGGETYRLLLTKADQAAETAIIPESDPFAASGTEEPEPTAAVIADPEPTKEVPAVVRLNDKAYTVTVQPYDPESAAEETQAEPTAPVSGTSGSDSGVVNVPVTIIEPESKTVVFEVEGQSYEIQLTETDPSAVPADAEAPVVWLEETPLRVTLQEGPSGSDSDDAFDIVLNPVSEEELPELLSQHFGPDYVPAGSASDPQPEAEPTEIPTELPAEPEEEGDWFSNLFNNIFGSAPTATPTPQVTVIPAEPTATVVKPTQTPIVVRVAATPVPQEPVRLDVTETAETVETAPKDLDPALLEIDDEETPVPTRVVVQAVTVLPDPTATARPDTEMTTDLQNETPETHTEAPAEQPTASPTPEELPHTGGAESWNIPSLLIMFAGLLLIIIGVRRLRMNRE